MNQTKQFKQLKAEKLSEDNHSRHEGRPDIRRRLRGKSDGGFYTLKILIEALRHKGKRLKGTTIALLGFPLENAPAKHPARIIYDMLKENVVNVRTFDPNALSGSSAQTLEDAVRGADAVVIATDHPAFRWHTPRHFKHFGAGIIVPTTLWSGQ